MALQSLSTLPLSLSLSLSRSLTCERNRRRRRRLSEWMRRAREAIIRRLFLPSFLPSAPLAPLGRSSNAAPDRDRVRRGRRRQRQSLRLRGANQQMKPIMPGRCRAAPSVRSCGPFLAFNYDIV